jgi:hypothetical protein|nr:MAG TPA: hypothetical protein [Caudoviricetes sp.]
MANISPELKKQLHAIAQKQAEKIAKKFEDKMTEHYRSVLDWYYGEPYQTNPPHYDRTNNLRNSYRTFMFISSKQVSSSFLISGDDMNDYGRKSKISGEDYLSKFFFNPLGTWHGGDWHGGYGVPANFNAYNEMVNFYKNTVKDFRKKYEI